VKNSITKKYFKIRVIRLTYRNKSFVTDCTVKQTAPHGRRFEEIPFPRKVRLSLCQDDDLALLYEQKLK